MADKIKSFFKKKKSDAKFKMAGPGHKLTDQQPDRSRFNQASRPPSVPSRSAPSSEARQAAAAALSRLDGQRPSNPTAFNTSLAAIQMQVKKELEAEKKAAAAAALADTTVVKAKEKTEDPMESPHLAVSGVYFSCPMISAEILTKDEWKKKIKEFLYEQLAEERGLTSCLIIHSCNKNREKVQLCVETLCKYLENIIQNPCDEKYRKIRMSNRIFKERVEPIEGSSDLLLAAGFQVCKQQTPDGEEDFYVFSEERLYGDDTLQMLCDALVSAEPIALELDRNLQVLLPSQAARRNELPPTFFSLTPEEIKREQQIRAEVLEKNLMLRTKAMREKEEQRELRKYRYALIRIRFPDGILLQGTFTVFEKLGAVVQFVRDNLVAEDNAFVLCSPTGHRLTEGDCDLSLIDLRLVPASILTFNWEEAADRDVAYLKPEVMLLVQNI